MQHTEVKLKFVLFSPSKPIKSPILLIESGRKIESQRQNSCGVGVWLPMKVLSQTARMVSSWQLIGMCSSRIPSDLCSGLPVGYSVTFPSSSMLSSVSQGLETWELHFQVNSTSERHSWEI